MITNHMQLVDLFWGPLQDISNHLFHICMLQLDYNLQLDHILGWHHMICDTILLQPVGQEWFYDDLLEEGGVWQEPHHCFHAVFEDNAYFLEDPPICSMFQEAAGDPVCQMLIKEVGVKTKKELGSLSQDHLAKQFSYMWM